MDDDERLATVCHNERLRALSTVASLGGLALVGGGVALLYAGVADGWSLLWSLSGAGLLAGSVGVKRYVRLER